MENIPRKAFRKAGPTRCISCKQRPRWRGFRQCRECLRRQYSLAGKRSWKHRRVLARTHEAPLAPASGPVDLQALMADLERAEKTVLGTAKAIVAGFEVSREKQKRPT